MKRRRSDAARGSTQKKAPKGPAKRTTAKRPERRAMIAALGPRVTGLSLRVARFVRRWTGVVLAWLSRALRPLLMWFFRGLAAGEAAVRALGRGAARAATAGATVLTPRRAIGLVMAASGALLVISQFIDYHGVQIGEQVELPGGIQSA